MPGQRIKVAQVSTACAWGGAEEHLLGLLQNLDRERFQIYLIARPQLEAEWRRRLPRDVIWRGWSPAGIRCGWEMVRLAEWLRRNRIQVVHSHLAHASWRAAPAARWARTALVVETPHLRESWRQGWKRHYGWDRWQARGVDVLIAVSHANGEYLRLDKGLPAHKIQVVPNGCDLNRFYPQPAPAWPREWGWDASDPVILLPGRIEAQKGHAVLLEAAAKIMPRWPRLRLLFAGDGSLRPHLEMHARNLELEAKWLGRQPNIERWLAAATVVALPSWYEGLPLVLLEALAMARPVAASHVDGVPEIIRDGQTGRLFTAGDSAQLAEILNDLLADPGAAQRLGRQGRRWVEQAYSLARQIQQTEQIYLQALVPRGQRTWEKRRARGQAAV